MKLPELYRDQTGNPLWMAQRNLAGRTHYVDDDTLRFHKSRVLSCHITDGGLLLAIITSDAADYAGATREFRPVIFDVFGTVIERPKLGEGYKTRAQASKAMWAALNALDAPTITREAAARYQRQVQETCTELLHAATDRENQAKAAA